MNNIYNAIQNLYNMDKTTWQEVLAELYNVVSNIENKFDLFEIKFGPLLGEQVTRELKKMYDNGSLASLINDVLLKDINKKVDTFKTEINEQLDNKMNLEGVRLNEKINISELFNFGTDDINYWSYQGMCITNNHIIIGVVYSGGTNNENTWLYFFNKDTTVLEKTIKNYCFKHCNSMTFNKYNNTVAIVGLDNNVFIVNALTFEVQQIKSLNHNCVSIAFDENERNYFIDRGNNTVYCYNENFEEQYAFNVIDTNTKGLTLQGLECKDKMLFFPYYCSTSSIPTNYIYVYDLKGNLLKTYLLGDLGEIEDLAFLNGRFLGNFRQGKRCYIFNLDITSHPKNYNNNDIVNNANILDGYEYYLKSGDDLNNLSSGIYRVNGSGIGSQIINSPTSFNFKIKVECLQNPLYILQTVVDRNMDIYTRIKDENNVWTTWNKINSIKRTELTTGNDLNNCKQEGVYTTENGTITNSILNKPSNVGYAFYLEVKRLVQNDNIEQVLTSRHLNGENNVGMWKRTYNVIDGWSSWYKVDIKLEKELLEGDDLNNFNKIGKFTSANGTITQSLLNAPTGIGFSIILEVIPQYEPSSIMQVIRSRHLNGQSGTGIWVRTYNTTDNWGNWFKIQMQ